jgi:hypothetical protein
MLYILTNADTVRGCYQINALGKQYMRRHLMKGGRERERDGEIDKMSVKRVAIKLNGRLSMLLMMMVSLCARRKMNEKSHFETCKRQKLRALMMHKT